ncbi:hypothetical protein V5799_020369 [Amblyomma americanum]|uniref:Uncharacterized protein n=1 Tax=Amblyomma americanum TaxID=6943 RepID=A0AAQ4EU92_AMBAM
MCYGRSKQARMVTSCSAVPRKVKQSSLSSSWLLPDASRQIRQSGGGKGPGIIAQRRAEYVFSADVGKKESLHAQHNTSPVQRTDTNMAQKLTRQSHLQKEFCKAKVRLFFTPFVALAVVGTLTLWLRTNCEESWQRSLRAYKRAKNGNCIHTLKTVGDRAKEV